MKSKRRHDLQKNVLAIEIGKIIDFFRRHGNHLATAALVIAVIVLGIVWWRGRAKSQEARLDRQWREAQSQRLDPAERVKLLTGLAEQKDNDRIAALAGVELGDEFARRLLAAKSGPEAAVLAEKAEMWYRTAIADHPQLDLAVAKAYYGLAKLAESGKQFKVAADHYNKILLKTALTGQPIMEFARVALQNMATLQQPVAMATTAPATAPAGGAATQPATRPTLRAVLEGEPTTTPATGPAP